MYLNIDVVQRLFVGAFSLTNRSPNAKKNLGKKTRVHWSTLGIRNELG